MNPGHFFQGSLYAKEPLVHEVFELAATHCADSAAIVFGEATMTYAALNAAATALSKVISTRASNEPVIGVSASRSLETIVSVIAILKSGKAYLPLDPSYPGERLRQLIADSGIKTCIAAPGQEPFFQELTLNTISNIEAEAGEATQTPGALAYVLYTSGSTGKPKGVCMGHGALVNLLRWQSANSLAGKGSKTLQFAPLTFDVSFQEIFATLTTGGTLVLVNEELRIEPNELLKFIEEQQVNRVFLPFVALQYFTEAASTSDNYPNYLQEIITAGEQLKITPAITRFFKELPQCSLTNQYGPTECHVVTSLTLQGNVDNWPKLPSIGTPIDNTEILILDEDGNEVPPGEAGELAICGKSLADGYLNQPQLTATKFREITSSDGKTRAYLTGDLARFLPVGDIEYLGRKDNQLKIRGVRIEPGEIEVLLNENPAIKQAAVAAKDSGGQKRLVAYLVAAGPGKNTQSVKDTLAKQLPDYMMPWAFVWLEDLPKTSSGKIDRNKLPEPSNSRPELSVLYEAPRTTFEKNIIATLQDLFGLDKIGINDNFFELGGNSLLALRTVTALHNQFNYILPITKLYQHPTAAAIALHLSGKTTRENVSPSANLKEPDSDADIAVIGMSLRFPEANTVGEFWKLLTEGKEATTFFSNEELSPFIDPEIKNAAHYVKARGIIDNVQYFDAAFFGINPKAAELMDPQQRIFLEIAWEVLEKSGHLPGKFNGTIGVYAGCGNNTYYLNNVLTNPAEVDKVGSFNAMTLNEKDYISSRTAYELNLKGPAVSLFSACSTSLLAVAQAVDAIKKGQCSLAIAGGAAITSPVNSGHLYQEGGVLSKDGHCRPFDSEATGTVFSDGAGVVLLKSLNQAKQDGDFIYGVIKGTGISNDGAGKGSFMAPNAEGQAAAIKMAIDQAGIKAADISYVEAHGTATAIGDPIEIEGLQIAFGEQQTNQFCAIGSVKSNIGHLTAASGIAGLIKTLLSLCHKIIPATLFHKNANPQIDFENSPFYVNTALKEWQSDNKRIAGISSFGVGGTNVHIIAQEYENDQLISGAGRPLQLVTWSAKSAESGLNYSGKLCEYLQDNKEVNLADVAFSLQQTRADFNNRYFTIAGSNAEAIANISTISETAIEDNKVVEKPAEVIFLFPGQGSQYPDMGRELYENEPVYKYAIDQCAAILQPILETDIRDIIFPGKDNTAEEKIYHTLYAQCAIFVTEYALSKLWINWGIVPSVLCGHSIGELVAAHLAGIFSLNDILHLIVARSRMINDLPAGKMLSVRLETARLTEILPESLSIAAINGDKLVVVAGPEKSITDFSELLTGREVINQVLRTSHAFHSSMLNPIIDDFKKVVEQMELHRPQKPVMSTVTGTLLTDAQATSVQYWCDHLRKTVLFSDAVQNLMELENPLFLEVGPGNVTASLARQQLKGRNLSIITTFENRRLYSEYHLILKALGRLWLQGLTPDWSAFYLNQQRIKLVVPTYAFNKKYCWIDPPAFQKPMFLPVTPAEQNAEQIKKTQNTKNQSLTMRKDALVKKINEIIEDASGITIGADTLDTNFLELGLDSLLLTQLALTLKKEFKLPVSFRQLQEDNNTVNTLADYFDQHLPATPFSAAPADSANPATVNNSNTSAATGDSLQVITLQLQMLAQQVALLQGNQSQTSLPAAASAAKAATSSPSNDLSSEELTEIKKPFGAQPKIDRKATAFTDKQNNFLQQLTKSYNLKTKSSKEYAQHNRSHMADPRVVTGFSPVTKEMIYSLVVSRSKGSRIWDIDGNEYIDVLNGFGSNMFGYQPEFLKKALYEQIEKGYELGPQHELAGEVSKMICDFTGLDRAGFCNTGSEAVLGAVRIARTVTGRSLIVAFTGSYHGIFDEVIIRGTKKLKSFPAAPGIMPEAVQNMLILDYGTDETLHIIKERADEIAAVLVEPVQSRRPEFTPVEFLKQVRQVTEQAGAVLIFDEVITGFRMHPGGAQAMFGIQADLATYGKVIGGGLPIGVIAGKRRFMDALDGGFWQYGDSSFPEVGVTYFAGTFVRHPLALATAKASLLYMKEKGEQLQKSINEKASRLAQKLTAEMQQRQLPMYVAHFGSLWKIKFKEDVACYELMFTLMRQKGIHIWDGFPCFMTEAHNDKDIDAIVSAFAESVDEMIEAGFYKAVQPVNGKNDHTAPQSAKLGRDKNGNPAWFITDPQQPGKYLQVK